MIGKCAYFAVTVSAMAFAALACVSPAARAQLGAPLALPSEAIEGSVRAATSLGKPPGQGPHPAVVIMTHCGGATVDMKRWGDTAIKRGYVALLVDSMQARKVPNTSCQVPPPTRAQDIFEAQKLLVSLPYVDQNRIYLLGFSIGGAATYLAAARPAVPHFRAAVSVYGGCMRPGFGKGAKPEPNLPPSFQIPLLALLGDKDTEAGPAECVPQFEVAKTYTKTFEWHVYPGGYHCWDCKSEHGRTVPDHMRNRRTTFSYSEPITVDTERRVFEFFDRYKSQS